MTPTLSRKPQANRITNLEDYEGRMFTLTKPHTTSITVKLDKVKRRDVQLAHTDGRVDTFCVSIAEFHKFYKLVEAE